MKEQSEGRKEERKKEEKGQSLYYIHSLPFFIAECVAALDLNGKKEKEEGGDELEEDRAYRIGENNNKRIVTKK
jgi:hypothetical protein